MSKSFVLLAKLFTLFIGKTIFLCITSCYSFFELFSFQGAIFAALRCYGGDEESRTPDPLLARQVLSQLSYTPIFSGVHLLSHTVASIVPSAACVLTVVFGMGTSVSHRRIGTGNLPQLSKTRQYGQPLLFSLERR